MRPSRVLTTVTMLVLLTHGAAAATSPFRATSLDLTGTATLDGAAAALFVVAPEDAVYSWTLTGATLVVERETVPYTQASTPRTGPITSYGDTRRETLTFTDAELTGEGAEDTQALLLEATDAATVQARMGAGFELDAVEDPKVDQSGTDRVDSPQGASDVVISKTLEGQHLRILADASSYEIAGDFTITLVGPDYQLRAAEGTYEGHTGQRVTSDVGGLVREGEDEIQRITITGGRLVLDAPVGAQLYTPRTSLAFTGALTATDPDGEFPLPLPTTDGRSWAGTGILDLALLDGHLAADAPAPITPAGTLQAPRTPPLLAMGLTALALAALGGLALLLALRRRAAAHEGDALELAILAMHDRRYDDALPHLDRALARAPHDARLLLDRALCLENTGRLPDARDAYEAALRAEPFNAETHYYYARTLTRLRNSTAALAHLGRALSLDARLTELARKESSFHAYRDHPQFARLIG